jgi:hypothetical protein
MNLKFTSEFFSWKFKDNISNLSYLPRWIIDAFGISVLV